MYELAGLTAPVFRGDDVRGMTDADRRAIAACDDPDALLALQLKLRTGTRVRGRRPVLLATGAVGIVAGMLIIAQADGLLVTVALVALVALIVVGMAMQSRGRKRVIAAVGWLGAIDFRLQQLATKG